MKKPRADSKLLNLPDEQAHELSEWLLGGMSYEKARLLLKKQFGILASLGALSRFWDSYCSVALLVRRKRAVSTAEEIAEEAAKEPGKFDEATIAALKQKAFELLIAPQADPNDVHALFALILKAKDQELKKDQILLDREKFEFNAAQAALAHLPTLRRIASDKSMDDAAKLQAVRKQLFGVLPES